MLLRPEPMTDQWGTPADLLGAGDARSCEAALKRQVRGLDAKGSVRQGLLARVGSADQITGLIGPGGRRLWHGSHCGPSRRW